MTISWQLNVEPVVASNHFDVSRLARHPCTVFLSMKLPSKPVVDTILPSPHVPLLFPEVMTGNVGVGVAGDVLGFDCTDTVSVALVVVAVVVVSGSTH